MIIFNPLKQFSHNVTVEKIVSRKNNIEQAITKALAPLYLNIENESGNHHVPEGSETHFKVIVVSEQFNGISRIARHRIVNQLLHQEFESGLHALSMHLYNTEEWELKNKSVLNSPACKDGYKNTADKKEHLK